MSPEGADPACSLALEMAVTQLRKNCILSDCPSALKDDGEKPEMGGLAGGGGAKVGGAGSGPVLVFLFLLSYSNVKSFGKDCI